MSKYMIAAYLLLHILKNICVFGRVFSPENLYDPLVYERHIHHWRARACHRTQAKQNNRTLAMLEGVQGVRGADPNMLYQSNTITSPENQNQMQMNS